MTASVPWRYRGRADAAGGDDRRLSAMVNVCREQVRDPIWWRRRRRLAALHDDALALR
jgi:hypothetical protein